MEPEYPKSWKKGMKKACIIYPNESFGGVYALGPLVLYNIINSHPDWICERRFLDDYGDLSSFDLVGFTWQYELDIRNIKEIIAKGNIKGKVMAGGPCVNNNYKPLQNYVDFFILGEAEDIMLNVLNNFDDLSKVEGVFIPGNEKKFVVTKNIDDYYPLYQPLPKQMDNKYVFGSVFILETERGCPFKCHFCPMPNLYEKFRFRSLDKIKEIIDKGIKLNKRPKVVIYSPSFAHPQRKEILKHLISKGLKFSVPSLKVELVDQELLDLISLGGQKSLTIAPECGETLRPSINKPVKDSAFFKFAKMCDKFDNIKLYFMVGLPGQGVEDLDEIIDFVNNFKFKKTYVSINPFVPKPFTHFCDHKFDKVKIKEQIKYLRKQLKGRVKFANVDTSYLEWKIAHSSSS